MSGRPGIDLPHRASEAQVTLPPSGVAVTGLVESVEEGDVLVLVPSVGDFAGDVAVTPGGAVEVHWQRPDDQRAVPAEVVSVDGGEAPRWRLRITGPAHVTQRRDAVRARLVLPVELVVDGPSVAGETADLSETGTRLSLKDLDRLPEPGARVQLRIVLEGGVLDAAGEVVRAHAHGRRSTLSLRFVGLEERDEDRVRRRVFQALREERARAVD